MRWLSNYNLKVFERSWFSEMIFYGVVWLVEGKSGELEKGVCGQSILIIAYLKFKVFECNVGMICFSPH